MRDSRHPSGRLRPVPVRSAGLPRIPRQLHGQSARGYERTGTHAARDPQPMEPVHEYSGAVRWQLELRATGVPAGGLPGPAGGNGPCDRILRVSPGRGAHQRRRLQSHRSPLPGFVTVCGRISRSGFPGALHGKSAGMTAKTGKELTDSSGRLQMNEGLRAFVRSPAA